MDYATTTVEIAVKIKEIIEQSTKNKKDLISLCGKLIDDCDDLETKRNKVKDDLPGLDHDFAKYITSLNEVFDNCRKLLRREPGFAGDIKHRVKFVVKGDAIKDLIIQARKDIKAARDKFSEDNLLELRIIGERWQAAQSAETGGDTLFVASPPLESVAHVGSAAPEIFTEKLRLQSQESLPSAGALTMESSRNVSIDKQPRLTTLSDKLQTFCQLVQSGTFLPAARTISPAGHVYMDTTPFSLDHVVDINLALREADRLSEILQDPESLYPAIEWISSAMHLTCSVFSLGLKHDALKLSELCCWLAFTLAKQDPIYQIALASCRNNMSVLLSASGDLEMSILSAEKAVSGLEKAQVLSSWSSDWNSKLATFQHHLSQLYLKAENYPAAQKCIDASIAYQDVQKLATLAPGIAAVDQAYYLLTRSQIYQKLDRMENANSSLKNSLVLLRDAKKTDRVAKVIQELIIELKKSGNLQSELCEALHTLSLTFAALQKRHNALEVLKEACEIVQSSGSKAKYLYELAVQYHESGLLHDATTAAQGAVNSAQELTEKNPRDMRSSANLAEYLHLLGDYLHEAKKYKEARPIIDKAVGIRFKLQEKDPRSYKAQYSSSLTLLCRSESYCGNKADALKHAEKALMTIEELTEDNPDKHKFTKASALFAYGRCLESNHKMKEAVAQYDEAISIRRHMGTTGDTRDVERYAERNRIKLAAYLEIASGTLRHQGKHRKALQYAEEAVKICREVYATKPHFAGKLAEYLTCKHKCLTQCGSHTEALLDIQEAEDMMNIIVQRQRTDSNLASHAKILDLMGLCLSQVGRHEEAVDRGSKAVDISQALETKAPQSFSATLFTHLCDLSLLHHNAGDHNKALEVVQNTVAYTEKFVDERPDNEVLLSKLALALELLCLRMQDAGQRLDSIGQARYMISVYSQLAAHEPKRYTPKWIAAWNKLIMQLWSLGHGDEAVDEMKKLISSLRNQDVKYQPDLASSLNKLAEHLPLVNKGSSVDALQASEEAVELARVMAEKNRKAHELHLGCYLAVLGLRRRDVGDTPSAVKALQESSKILSDYITKFPAVARESYCVVQEQLIMLGGK